MMPAEHKRTNATGTALVLFYQEVIMTRDFPLITCAGCGRQFRLYTQDWIYKRNHRYYCRWSCFSRCCYGKEKACNKNS